MDTNNKILEKRAQRAQCLVSQNKFKKYWRPYPSNSVYFLCVKLNEVSPEKLRVHLLDRYKAGTVALGKSDLRTSFSGLEENKLE